MTVRVLVADDHELVGAGLAFVLEAAPDISVVARVPLNDVVRVAAEHRPDVVVMDAAPQTADIIGKVVSDGARVFVLAAGYTVGSVCEALYAGASGYLLKASAPAALAGVVRAVYGLDAGTWLDAPILAGILQELSAAPALGDRGDQVNPLTTREHEVLVLMAAGLTNAQIAQRLYLSPLTVRTHVGRVITKLGVRNRAHAVTAAYRTGIVRILSPGSYDIRRTTTA